MKKKPIKKKPVQKPWRTGFWSVGTFQYTGLQKEAILDILPASFPADPDKVIEDMEELARGSQGQARNEEDKPLPRTIREQLTKVEDHTRTLLDTLQGLHSPTLAVLNGKPPVLPIRALTHQLQTLRTRAGWLLAVRKQAGPGRPRKQMTRPRNMELRRFVGQLLVWWSTHTDKPPVSSHDDIENSYRGDFHHFAVAVITPVHGALGLDAIIERIVQEWNRLTKNS